jgi:uncharacterized protein YeaO (DUF488 family)
MIKDDKPLLKRFPAEESDGKRVIIAIGIGLAKMHHMQFHEWRPELAPTRILKNDFLSRKNHIHTISKWI